MNVVGGIDVSRETFDQLHSFAALVEKWTPRINLISKSSISQIWDRHIEDSAQLYEIAPKAGHWVDLGSGGGFPGIVLSILAKGDAVPLRFTLIESDQRKCAFLRTASRELGLGVTVLSERIETATPDPADVLSARALTDLDGLLGFAQQHLKPDGVALFPKGESWKEEQERAENRWSYRFEAIKSRTNAAAAVLKIQEIERV